jgi:hypothetical protein
VLTRWTLRTFEPGFGFLGEEQPPCTLHPEYGNSLLFHTDQKYR